MSCKKEEMNIPPQPPLPEKDEAGVINVESYVPTDILAIQENQHIQNISLTGGPANTKIYWSWYDPDDPATNGDIDPYSVAGEDDSISIQFLDVYEENGNYYTITDEQGNTNLRYKIIWKDAWKTFPGDNFQIIGVAGSPNGEDSSILW